MSGAGAAERNRQGQRSIWKMLVLGDTSNPFPMQLLHCGGAGSDSQFGNPRTERRNCDGPHTIKVWPASGSKCDAEFSVPRSIGSQPAQLYMYLVAESIALCLHFEVLTRHCWAQKNLGGHLRVIHRGNSPGMGIA